MALPVAFFLLGPTAVGKSDVAHIIARRHGWGILSADSMMVYRGLDIGTAKPSAEERAGINYWGLDLVDPSEEYNTSRYLEAARAAVKEASDRSLTIIVAGGTGLYIKALAEGLLPAPPADSAWREEAEAILDAEGLPGLQREVERRAPEAYRNLADASNPRRLIRAVERGDAGPANENPSIEPATLIGLNLERSLLYERITERVEKMMKQGLVDEVEAVTAKGDALSTTAREAIGYREAQAVLDGGMNREEAVEHIVRRTRRLAKRQLTWFRHQHRVHWVEANTFPSPESLADQVEAQWRHYGPTPLCI